MIFLLIESGLHVEYRILGRLQHRIEAAQDGHGEDDVAVFAPDKDIAQAVVGDVPDEVGDPVEVSGVH